MIETLLFSWAFTSATCVYLYIIHKLNENKDKSKNLTMSLINKWQDKLQLTGWKFPTQEMTPEQVVYSDDCPDEDKYFVGIEIDKHNKVGTIHHDIELTEQYIIHELLHVKYPNKSEDWVNEVEELITTISR
jgi:hypothetical protein